MILFPILLSKEPGCSSGIGQQMVGYVHLCRYLCKPDNGGSTGYSPVTPPVLPLVPKSCRSHHKWHLFEVTGVLSVLHPTRTRDSNVMGPEGDSVFCLIPQAFLSQGVRDGSHLPSKMLCFCRCSLPPFCRGSLRGAGTGTSSRRSSPVFPW